MPENSTDTIRRYLIDAIAAERTFETQLRAFSSDGDDDEVQAVFRNYADESRGDQALMEARLADLGGGSPAAKGWLGQILALAPKAAQSGHTLEERTVQNLITAFAAAGGARAMYESLVGALSAAGEQGVEQIARAIQERKRSFAAKVWTFIPSRSKIAFNILTVDEIDPAVETRTLSNRIE